jgi:hypothetical protein
MTVNKHTPVSVANVPVKEGVIHLVSSLLIPPHEHDHSDADVPKIKEEGHEHEHGHKHHELSVHELMERLEAYLE